MFRAAYRSSPGASNCICILWFIYPCGDRPLSRLGGKWPVLTQPGQQPVTTWAYKPEAANTVWSSRCWAVCRSKYFEPSINFGIINSITMLHLVGYIYWFILRWTGLWILYWTPPYKIWSPGRHGPLNFYSPNVLWCISSSITRIRSCRVVHFRISFCHHHHHHHHWLDSPWWALAFLRSLAHSSLSRATFFQFLTSDILIYWSTPSSHCNFGLPTFLTPSSLVFNP